MMYRFALSLNHELYTVDICGRVQLGVHATFGPSDQTVPLVERCHFSFLRTLRN
jgi:hypothetical protein